MEAGAIHPTLDIIAADPTKAAALPATMRAVLLAQCAAVVAALAAPMLAAEAVRRSASDFDLGVMTTKQLAETWEMPEAKIRELCRTGLLPAKKLGAKEWVIGMAALRDWLPNIPLASDDSVTLSSRRDPRRGSQAASAARPFTVEVRRAPRRPQGQRRQVGSRVDGYERDNGLSAPRAGAAGNGRRPAAADETAPGVNSSPEGTLR